MGYRRRWYGSAWMGMLCLLGVGAIGCQAGPVAPPADCPTLPVEVNKDLTLTKACSPYLPEGNVKIRGDATLTIEAGVTIKMADGAGMNVGINGNGSVIAKGTASEPIVITSANPTPAAGAWEGVLFWGDGPVPSALEHVHIKYAGSSSSAEWDRACLSIRSLPPGSISLSHVRFEACENHGLILHKHDGGVTSLTGLSFKDIGGYGIVLHPNNLGQVKEAFQFDGVTANLLRSGGVNSVNSPRVTDDATWIAQSIPWHADGDIVLNGDDDQIVKVTVMPGVQIFWSQGGLQLEQANFQAIGTSAEPIVFGAATQRPKAGDWNGLYLRSKISAVTLKYVVVKHAGFDDSNYTKGAITLKNTAGRVSIESSTFIENHQSDIWVDCKSKPNLVDNTHSGSVGVGGPEKC